MKVIRLIVLSLIIWSPAHGKLLTLQSTEALVGISVDGVTRLTRRDPTFATVSDSIGTQVIATATADVEAGTVRFGAGVSVNNTSNRADAAGSVSYNFLYTGETITLPAGTFTFIADAQHRAGITGPSPEGIGINNRAVAVQAAGLELPDNAGQSATARLQEEELFRTPLVRSWEFDPSGLVNFRGIAEFTEEGDGRISISVQSAEIVLVNGSILNIRSVHNGLAGVSGTGAFANVDALNTARIFARLPPDVSFEAGDLDLAWVSIVPLPAGVWLFLSSVGFLFLLKKSRPSVERLMA